MRRVMTWRPQIGHHWAVSLAFIRSLAPSAAVRPPKGDDWLHEPNWDGSGFRSSKTAATLGFIRATAPNTPTACRPWPRPSPTQSAILDGELCVIDHRGAAHFYKLMAQMRTGHPDERQLMFLAFDLLHQDGVDLRGLPLSERKRDLNRLCRKALMGLQGLAIHCPDRRLGPIFGANFSKYPLDVNLHGCLSDLQLIGDHLVRCTLH
jgi:ATP dependent DNA ligase domain